MLKLLVILCILSLVSLASSTTRCKCTPGSSCWPSAFDWNVLNYTVQGRLLRLEPAAEVCYPTSDSYDPVACAQVRTNYASFPWREANPSTVLAINNEFLKDQTCPLPVPADNTSICYQGGVSIYAVNATSVKDVQDAVLFANLHNLRVVLKSTGHDFLGRSSAPGSLLIWTRFMNTLSHTSSFSPSFCPFPSYSGPAVTVQPGNMWADVYAYVESVGYNVVGGAGPTVGAGGGYPQGGGHSPLSPKYGMATDNVLQYEVVTALGLHLVVNECLFPDLFWALRGGGGGTFAVLVSVTYRAHIAAPVTVGQYRISTTNKTSWISAMEYLATAQPSWSDQGWSGYYYPTQTRVTLYIMAPNVTVENFTATIAPFQAYAATLPGLTLTGAPTLYSNFSYAYSKTIQAVGDAMTSYGFFGSRLMPRSVHENNPQGIAQALWDSKAVLVCATAGGEVNRKNSDSVGLNPAWRQAVWHAITEVSWTATTPYSEQLELRANHTARIQLFRDIAPNSGCYFNEMDEDEPNWQQASFGSHYTRLLQIKQTWDPTQLFLCHHCVGSEGWDLDTNCPTH